MARAGGRGELLTSRRGVWQAGERVSPACTIVRAVVGEYLGSAEGVGYLIHQAEGVFDINTVLLTGFAPVLHWIVGALEKRLMVWQLRSGETERF